MMHKYFLLFVVFLLIGSLPINIIALSDHGIKSVVEPSVNMVEEPSVVHILFLHGMPETEGVLIPLKEKLEELFSACQISLDWRYPHLPDAESVDKWAENIATEIKNWSPDGAIVIIGLSMGGKAAVHAVANDRFGIQDKVKTVITINSPIKDFQRYYNCFFGYRYPRSIIPLMATRLMGYEKPDGLFDVLFFDSTNEANWIAHEKQLLTFTSGELLPNDSLYDDSLGDMFPRDCDDGTVPLSAQYTSSSNTVYYGVCAHESVFRDLSVGGARDRIAENITDFLLGDPIHCSVLVKNGCIHHQAGLIPLKTSWMDTVGNGSLVGKRDRFLIQIKEGSCALNTEVTDAYWSLNDPMSAEITIGSFSHWPFGRIQIHYEIFEKRQCNAM